MRICCFNICSNEKLTGTLRGALTGAVIHTTGGAILGALGTVILSPAGLSAAAAAKIAAVGGAILGTSIHAVRGYCDHHFGPQKSMTHALVELGTGYLIVIIQSPIGNAICGSPAIATQNFLSNLTSSSITGGMTLVALLIVKFSSNLSCPQFGWATSSSTSVSETPSQMLSRLGRV